MQEATHRPLQKALLKNDIRAAKQAGCSLPASHFSCAGKNVCVSNRHFLPEACVPPDMPELEVLLHDLCDCDQADNSLSNTYTGVVKDLESILVKSAAIFFWHGSAFAAAYGRKF